MKQVEKKFVALTVIWAGMGVFACCQVSPDAQSAPIPMIGPARQAVIGSAAAGEVVRKIDDPHTGDRWLLMRDSTHPGGPGRLIQVARGAGQPAAGARAAAAPRRAPEPEPLPEPAIRSGDRLIVEESTPKVEARLEAVALGRAFVGAPLRVRLAIGGKVVRAVALGPGRAAFAPAMEGLR
jgi:hypothetical protein